MFRTLIYPSSGACDSSVELPQWSYCSWFDVCWSFGVVGLEWYPCCRLTHNLCFSLQHGYNSNTHRTKSNMTNVVIQQNSRKLLMMDILISETCWAHKKWNKITRDIKLVFYSSTNVMIKVCYDTMYFNDVVGYSSRYRLTWSPLLYAVHHGLSIYANHCLLVHGLCKKSK